MPTPDDARTKTARAAVFVDYDNVYRWLENHLHRRHDPAAFVSEMIKELRRYLQELNQTQTAIINAYADFGVLCDNGQAVQNALYLVGAESRFVPTHVQDNAAEIQLCIDAVDVLHHRPDIGTFVVLTGDRPYLPLVQQFKRYGHHAFVAALEVPEAGDNHDDLDHFLDAHHLLGDDSQDELPGEAPYEPPTRGEEVEYFQLDSLAYHTIKLIEEHFGQYEEVYLTPLLRKLSELLGPDADPKALVSELEDGNAVWLEKRRGTPYDYTVLIVDDEHPDVQSARDEFFAEQLGEGYRDGADGYELGSDGQDVLVAYKEDADGVIEPDSASLPNEFADELDFTDKGREHGT